MIDHAAVYQFRAACVEAHRQGKPNPTSPNLFRKPAPVFSRGNNGNNGDTSNGAGSSVPTRQEHSGNNGDKSILFDEYCRTHNVPVEARSFCLVGPMTVLPP